MGATFIGLADIAALVCGTEVAAVAMVVGKVPGRLGMDPAAAFAAVGPAGLDLGGDLLP
jgi:hypothetical protein